MCYYSRIVGVCKDRSPPTTSSVSPRRRHRPPDSPTVTTEPRTRHRGVVGRFPGSTTKSRRETIQVWDEGSVFNLLVHVKGQAKYG